MLPQLPGQGPAQSLKWGAWSALQEIRQLVLETTPFTKEQSTVAAFGGKSPWKGQGLRKAAKQAQGSHHPQREPTLEHTLALAKPHLYKGCSAEARGQVGGGTLGGVSECQSAVTGGEAEASWGQPWI